MQHFTDEDLNETYDTLWLFYRRRYYARVLETWQWYRAGLLTHKQRDGNLAVYRKTLAYRAKEVQHVLG